LSCIIYYSQHMYHEREIYQRDDDQDMDDELYDDIYEVDIDYTTQS